MPDPRFRSETLSDEERQCLILQHLPQVRIVARKIHGRLPENVSLDDLVSTGVVALISAIDRFDPSRRAQLRTYAEYKIKGGILDSLRRLDSASRLQRKQAKRIEAAIAAVEQRFHRAPTEQEIAAELDITIDRYREWQVNVHRLRLGRLEASESEDSEKCGVFHFISSDPSELPSAVFERRELQRALAGAISRLPKKHQTILSLCYREGLTLTEIGKIVGLHVSRVSQIRSRAILYLRARMAKLWPTGGRREAAPRSAG